MGAEQDPRLLVSVVARGLGDKVVDIARSAGATGSTVLFGRGTTANKLLCLLCLADVEKELIFTIAPLSVMGGIETALRSAPDLYAKTPAIGILVNVGEFFRLGVSAAVNNNGLKSGNEEGSMESVQKQASGRVLLCVVVNAGLADDLMRAARDAGAKGGTILRARGTGRDEDHSFFGITIVPEKELLMILAAIDEQAAITEAIRNSPGLDQPGVGVFFSLPVEKFFTLGKKGN